MAKVILIDDEELARALLREFLQPYADLEIVQECSNGFEGVKAIHEQQPDLIFLDIQMPKINGFEMLELLDPPPAVIFTTAFDEYAIRAFETHAIDYLLKPFDEQRLGKAIRKWREQQPAERSQHTQQLVEETAARELPQQRIVVKTGSKIKIIPVKDVDYLEAADDYVKIITAEGSFLKNKTMSFFEKALDDAQFVRCHRSFMVNVQKITRIDPYEKENHLAILKTGAKIPVSRNGYGKLKTVLGL